MRSRNQFGFAAGILGLAGILLSGCTHPSISEQVRLSRPGLLFSDSPVLTGTGAAFSAVEPGTDSRGGAGASGCTACR